MPVKIALQKPAEQLAEPKSRSAQHPVADKAAIKPGLRTPLELKRLTNRLLTAPDTVTTREFNLLTSVIGLRSAHMLMDRGRRNNQQAALSLQPSISTAPPADKMSKKIQIRPAEPSSPEMEPSQVKDPPKPLSQTAAAGSVNPALSTSVSQAAGKLQVTGLREAPLPFATASKSSKGLAHVESASMAKAEGKSEAAPRTKFSTKSEAKPEKNSDAKSTALPTPVAAKPAAVSSPLSAALKQPAAKTPAKAPVVKIKGDHPGSIINQLDSIAPTEIVEAYAQAAEVSGGALEQQRQQAEKALPVIPTPTGIASGKEAVPGNLSKKPTLDSREPNELHAFQSEKKGGGVPAELGNFPEGTEEEDPEQIMDEARQFATHPQKIGLAGEADPSQVTSFQAEAVQHVQAARNSEMEQTRQDFGEQRIQPKPDAAILKSEQKIRGVSPPAFHVKSTGAIPPDVASYLNPHLQSGLHAYMKNSQKEYQKGKEPFDTGINTAKVDTKAEVERLKTVTADRQRNEQAAAKAAVSGYRDQWQDEIKATTGEFEREADTAAEEKTKGIIAIKADQEGKVKKTLSEAEAKSRQEYKSTKSKAEDKQKEGEKANEQGKKKSNNPWEWLKEKGRQIGDAIKKGVNFLFSQLRKTVKLIFDKAKQAVISLIEQGRKLIVSAIKGFGNLLKGLVNKVFARFPGIAKRISSLIDRAVNKAVQAVNTAASLLKKGVTATLNLMGKTLDSLFAGVQSLYNRIMSGIGKFLSGDFKVNFGKFLEGAQIAAEIAAAIATGGGSVLVQIVTWLATTLPNLFRQASSVISFVNTLRSIKVQDLKQLLHPAGMGGFLVKGLFGELKPLPQGRVEDKEKDSGKAPPSGREEKGLVKVLQLLMSVFQILQSTVGKVSGAINKVLPVINLSGKSWFNPFSMIYAGAVQALDVVKNPAEALGEGAGKLKEAAGSFFKSIRGKVAEAASGIKAKVMVLGNPAQLITLLANKAVDMVLNFIITHPPSALIKAVFKGIEAASGQSMVELIRKHIPFADNLINKIAGSSPVRSLMKPLEQPVQKVSGMIDEATTGATSLVDEAESHTGTLFGSGTKLLAGLAGKSGGEGAGNGTKKDKSKAENTSGGGSDFLGSIKGGIHTRLLAIGKKLLKSGVNVLSASAGKIKNAVSGLLLRFKMGSENHKLWVEKSGTGHVVKMASVEKTLDQIIKAFEGRLENVKDKKNASKDSSRSKIVDYLGQLQDKDTQIRSTPLDKLSESDLGPIKDLITKIDGLLEVYAEGTGKTVTRTQAELDALATDPAIGNKITSKTIAEREVGLGLESKGEVTGLTRDPSGKAEFIEASGQKWDVKAYNSNFAPKKGGFTLNKSMESINKSLSEGENVMVDTRNLSSSDLTLLKNEVLKQGLGDRVKFWP